MAKWKDNVELEETAKRIPEQKLWTCVLLAACEDAIISKSKGYILQQVERELARDWFLHPTEAFYKVCTWAGYNPKFVYDIMSKKIETTKLWEKINNV
jgi:hypothetical protein|tara:strand:- start:235 stop:528 length:294 start_codon:yes stop_codon:yes gene_type:complete